MKDELTPPNQRHAKIFSLLHQFEQVQEPAKRAKAAAARYIDDDTAHMLIKSCIASLKGVQAAQLEKEAKRP